MTEEEPALPVLKPSAQVASEIARVTIDQDDPGREPQSDPKTAEVKQRARMNAETWTPDG